MTLKVYFFDATGNLIETFEAACDEAMKRIARFVELHGTDPDEDGRDAMPGGDFEGHEVCLVPGTGTYFARCLRPPQEGEQGAPET